MSDRTQDEVVTLDALRAAAKLIGDDEPWRGRDYEHNRAEFWRMAYRWERYRQPYADGAVVDEADKIIAEVEART